MLGLHGRLRSRDRASEIDAIKLRDHVALEMFVRSLYLYTGLDLMCTTVPAVHPSTISPGAIWNA